MLEQSYTKEVSAVIHILIQDYERLFGGETPPLFLPEAAEEQGQEAKPPRGEAKGIWAFINSAVIYSAVFSLSKLYQPFFIRAKRQTNILPQLT
jgi:hypothetical protein